MNKTNKKSRSLNFRRLHMESLESRELLSVSPTDFAAIRSQYADLELSANINDYNVIEITAAQLSESNLRDAITEAGKTTANDLIVVRNDKNIIVDLKDKSLEINIDSTIFGSIGIVSLGQNKLQLQSNSASGVISVSRGDVTLGGVVLTGIENSQHESLDASGLLQTNIGVTLRTSQIIKVSENSNRAGNFTILTDLNISTELQSTSGGSLIGSKSYSITVDVDGTSGSLEAYLTGLTETEKNSIVAGSTAFLSTLQPFDAEKNGSGDIDLCWAGTSSNMLAYTGWGDINGFQTEDDIFDYFRNNFTDAPGRSYYGNDWFVTGNYRPTGWSDVADWAQLKSTNSGGFYQNENINNIAADACTMVSATGITGAVNKLKEGAAIGLSIGWYNSSHMRTGGHAITMWGAIYDTSKSSSANDYYVSLLISDSDDDKNDGVNAINVLKSLNIEWKPEYGEYYFTNYSSSGYLENYTWLSQYSTDTVPTPTPTNFRTTGKTDSGVTLAWDTVSDAKYIVQRRALNESGWAVYGSNGSITSTSATFEGTKDTTYEWRICAVKDGKYSNWSPSIFASTNIISLADPDNFSNTAQTENSVTLKWDIVLNAISYKLQYKKINQDWTTWSDSLKPSANSETITGLESGTSYQFKICSVNGDMSSSGTSITIATVTPPVAPPTAPANFKSDSQTYNSVTLTWDSQSNLTGYTLEYKKYGDSNWSTWTSAPDITATTATITGLDALTKYEFKLTATNANDSAYSTTDATTKIALPNEPTNFKSDSQTHNSVTLTWNSQNNLTGYTLEYKKYGDSNWSTWTSAPSITATTATITGLDASTKYEFKLTATNASGFAYSTTDATTKIALPNEPTNFKSDSQTHNSVTLTWDSQNNLTGYTLEYKKSGDPNWDNLIALDATKTTITVINLDASTQYDFRINATNESGTSGYATINKIQTSETPTLPAPQNLRVVTTGQTTIALDWNDVDGATGYIVQRKLSSDSDFTALTSSPVTNSKFVDSGLTLNTEYEYCVQATSSVGNSGYATLTVTTAGENGIDGKPIADTPMFVTEPVYDSTENNVTLEWTNLGNDYTYVLYKAGRVVVDFSSDSRYIDTKPSSSGVDGYALLAFNKITGEISSVTMSVVHTTAKPLEISGHENLPNGQFKLLWEAEAGVIYSVFRAGRSLSEQLTFNDNIGYWIDNNPLANNDYLLVATYPDGDSFSVTFSNIYNLKKTVSSQSATALNAFWADYGLNPVDDDILNAIA